MQRHLPFQRGINFRDMGGYSGAGGRTRWRHLYRSGHLNQLTPDDVSAFAALGIRAAYDFRSDAERMAEPSVCHPENGSRCLSIWPRGHHSGEDLAELWIGGRASEAEIMTIQ